MGEPRRALNELPTSAVTCGDLGFDEGAKRLVGAQRWVLVVWSTSERAGGSVGA